MKTNKQLFSFLLAGLLCLIPLLAQALSSNLPMETPSLGIGVRPEGMGNAFVAMPGTDENAMFYNPAAINDYSDDLHFRILSPSFEFTPSMIGVVQDMFNLANQINGESTNPSPAPGTTTDSRKITDFNNFINQHSGQFQDLQVRLPFLTVMNHWFAASLLMDSRTEFAFRNESFPNIAISSISDIGGVFGGAYGFFNDRLQAGANVKVLYRYSIDTTLTSDEIINNSSFGNAIPRNKSIGVGGDLGLKGTIPTMGNHWMELLKPTAGLTWQDVGDTRFSNGVPNTPQSLSAGLAVHPTLGVWQFHVDNDFRELNQDETFMKKWNIGAEALAPNFGFFRPSIRIGGHQGYISGGLTLDFKYAKLEFATYAEEIGVYNSEQGVRRIAVNLSFGL